MISKRFVPFILLILFTLQFLNVSGVQRFPKPEFESGYVQPETLQPAGRSERMEIVDVFALAFALAAVSWLVLGKRSHVS